MAACDDSKTGLDKSSNTVYSWVKALREGSDFQPSAKKKSTFLLFVAICGKESGALQNKFSESLSSGSKSLGTLALERLAKSKPGLLDCVSDGIKKIQNAKSEIKALSVSKRSEVIKTAIKAGRTYFVGAADYFEKRDEKCSWSIECCDSLESGQMFLRGLRDVCNGCRQTKGVKKLEEILNVEMKVWHYWSLYTACLKHLAEDENKEVKRSVTATNSLDECISAYEMLENWITSDSVFEPPLKQASSNVTGCIVAKQPTLQLTKDKSSQDSGNGDTDHRPQAKNSAGPDRRSLEENAAKQSAGILRPERNGRQQHEELSAEISTLKEYLQKKEERIKELEKQLQLNETLSKLAETQAQELKKKDEEIRKLQKENEQKTQQIENLKGSLEFEKKKSTSNNDAKSMETSTAQAPTTHVSFQCNIPKADKPAQRNVESPCSDLGTANEPTTHNEDDTRTAGSAENRGSIPDTGNDNSSVKPAVAETPKRSKTSSHNFSSRAFVEMEEISDSRRPSQTAKRFEELFIYTYDVAECFEDAMGVRYDDKKSSKFLLDILVAVHRAATLKLAELGRDLEKAFDLNGFVDSPMAKRTINNCAVSLCKLSSRSVQQAHSWIWTKAVEFQNWRKSGKNKFLRNFLFLEKIDHLIMKSVPVFWDMVLQKRLLMLTYNDTIFDPFKHERFFDSDKTSDKIDYFVWPCLVEEETNRVLAKGKVVTRKKSSTKRQESHV